MTAVLVVDSVVDLVVGGARVTTASAAVVPISILRCFLRFILIIIIIILVAVMSFMMHCKAVRSCSHDRGEHYLLATEGLGIGGGGTGRRRGSSRRMNIISMSSSITVAHARVEAVAITRRKACTPNTETP